jgi:hypothetical protein
MRAQAIQVFLEAVAAAWGKAFASESDADAGGFVPRKCLHKKVINVSFYSNYMPSEMSPCDIRRQILI